MPQRIPIGIDDFRKLREGGLEYIDKSDLIERLVDRPGVEVVLLPRPRRFGKTLNLSMLRCYFEKRAEDLSHLFDDLSVWRAATRRTSTRGLSLACSRRWSRRTRCGRTASQARGGLT